VLLEHRGNRPKVHDSAYVAPNATLCGDVTVGENSRVMFGATLTAEGGPVEVGSNCVVMENAVLRGTERHPTKIGENCVVGPGAHLVGCRVGTRCASTGLST
jgi:carbonic anhydrase/acetyltransferase-like protein (isoleucine patch superfamily)